MIKSSAVLSMTVLALGLAGCSAKTAYQTLQATGHQQCLREPPSEQASCESRVIKDDYENYNKNRGSD